HVHEGCHVHEHVLGRDETDHLELRRLRLAVHGLETDRDDVVQPDVDVTGAVLVHDDPREHVGLEEVLRAAGFKLRVLVEVRVPGDPDERHEAGLPVTHAAAEGAHRLVHAHDARNVFLDGGHEPRHVADDVAAAAGVAVHDHPHVPGHVDHDLVEQDIGEPAGEGGGHHEDAHPHGDPDPQEEVPAELPHHVADRDGRHDPQASYPRDNRSHVAFHVFRS